jgi:hypothetical protein
MAGAKPRDRPGRGHRERRSAGIVGLLTLAAGVVGLSFAACKKERMTRRDPIAACNALWDSAEREVAGAVPSAQPCAASVECDVVGTNACLVQCATTPIRKADVPAFLAKRKQIVDTTCKRYEDADCSRLTPRPVASCATPRAVCREGRCALEPWTPP